jgi:DNA-binding MarR family transcriptional regulator
VEDSQMSRADKQIEKQLTTLLRRGYRVRLDTDDGDLVLDRAAYGTLCKLADDGPQHLAALAHALGLDPSTITRQVRSLEASGLASRTSDPFDRRVVVLELTDTGRAVLERARTRRRASLHRTLASWSEADLNDFGRLMKEFNASMDRLRDY